MADIKVVRFFTGEDVLCEMISTDSTAIEIKNGIVIIPTAQEQITFTPYSPFSKKEETLVIDKDKVVFIATPEDDLLEHYKTVFNENKIVAPKQEIFTG